MSLPQPELLIRADTELHLNSVVVCGSSHSGQFRLKSTPTPQPFGYAGAISTAPL
jgi:hypothetical protein